MRATSRTCPRPMHNHSNTISGWQRGGYGHERSSDILRQLWSHPRPMHNHSNTLSGWQRGGHDHGHPSDILRQLGPCPRAMPTHSHTLWVGHGEATGKLRPGNGQATGRQRGGYGQATGGYGHRRPSTSVGNLGLAHEQCPFTPTLVCVGHGEAPGKQRAGYGQSAGKLRGGNG